ncbi:helix-turn-helix domain-containing protein [Gottfriedia sp. NPDC057991]|uniref:helix-turn-helix domain-containing protein n=1 Tax=Gottfriedia sp. NPDC057991 TaxID=3346298 RepID=UPI0036D99DD2
MGKRKPKEIDVLKNYFTQNEKRMREMEVIIEGLSERVEQMEVTGMNRVGATDLIELLDELKTYSVREVSNLLGVQVETVRRWVRNGQLPSLTKNHYQILGSDLKRWLVK